MYLVAHQDDCQMVVGTPKAGTIQNIRNPEYGEMIGLHRWHTTAAPMHLRTVDGATAIPQR